MRNGQQGQSSSGGTRKRASGDLLKNGTSLRAEVKDALLVVLRDPAAPGSAKASAARTLAEFYFEDEDNSIERKPITELTNDEIDAQIAQYGANKLGG